MHLNFDVVNDRLAYNKEFGVMGTITLICPNTPTLPEQHNVWFLQVGDLNEPLGDFGVTPFENVKVLAYLTLKAYLSDVLFTIS